METCPVVQKKAVNTIYNSQNGLIPFTSRVVKFGWMVML